MLNGLDRDLAPTVEQRQGRDLSVRAARETRREVVGAMSESSCVAWSFGMLKQGR